MKPAHLEPSPQFVFNHRINGESFPVCCLFTVDAVLHFFVEVSRHLLLFAALSHAVTSPRTWSIDEVAKLVEKTDLKDYVTLLRENVSVSNSLVSYVFLFFVLFSAVLSKKSRHLFVPFPMKNADGRC